MKIHHTNKFIGRKSRGFTLVETLIAIAVLMIAIAGPLVIASKGLRAALYSKDQMIASFLAQESLEIIKNKRDQGYKEYLDGGTENWLTYISPSMGACLEGVNYCDAGLGGINDSNGLDPYEIYFDSATGYNNSGTGYKTIFSRYYYLSPVNVVGTSNPDSDQKMAHVFVEWKEGTIPFAIELTGLITNQKR